jgi:AraC-like DNA-binding protein
MIYRTYIPPPPLADFVELFWLYEGYAPSHAKERVLPSGPVELVINLRDDRLRVYDVQHVDQCQHFRAALICGPHSESFVIDTAQQASLIGVHFRPGGAFPFFTAPACELHNAHVSLDTLWGATASDLRAQLLAAETPEVKFRTLTQFLLAQAALPLARHPAVAFALQEFHSTPHPRTITDVTEHIGLSARRFIQVFKEQVGLTPKLFCRVRRFQRVLHCIRKGQHVEWADIALACGYFDQAHFIHDFRAFSGLNPTAYLIHQSEHLNHVPLGK